MSYAHTEPTPPSPDTVIWRYMDDVKFGDLLKRFSEHDQWLPPRPGTHTIHFNAPGQLWLAFPDSFDDDQEGAFPAVNEDPENYCDRMAELLGLSPDEAKVHKVRFLSADTQSIRDCNRDMAQLCGVSCWTARDAESRRMWDDYVPTRNGVAIRSTCQHLEQSLADARCSAVQNSMPSICKVGYVDHGSYLLQYDGYRGLLSIVQQMFSHENEVRVVCKSPELAKIMTHDRLRVEVGEPYDREIVDAARRRRLNEIAAETRQACRDRTTEGFHLPISLPILINELILKPGCASDYESTVREQLSQIGCSSTPVRHSSLI